MSLIEPCIAGDMSSLLTVDPATTTTPDDDDIASCSFECLQPSSISPLGFSPIRGGSCLADDDVFFFRVTSQISVSPAALCHPLTLSSKTSSKITRCPDRLLAICLQWRWKPIGAASQRNPLSQQCRGTIDASAFSFCGILQLQLTCRLMAFSCPSNF